MKEKNGRRKFKLIHIQNMNPHITIQEGRKKTLHWNFWSPLPMEIFFSLDPWFLKALPIPFMILARRAMQQLK